MTLHRGMVGGALLLVAGAGYLLIATLNPPTVTRITATVDSGIVTQIVSVTGIITAEDTAALSFPVQGRVAQVNVRKGDNVVEGQILATLESREGEANLAAARAAVADARAALALLDAGVREETRAVTTETVRLKEAQLVTTRQTTEQAIATAKRTLLNTELTSYTNNTNKTAVPPLVSGTYQCDAEGMYVISVFRSNAQSGFSFTVRGLEEGTFDASLDQPATFGSCGLRLLFTAGGNYANTTWYIDIPNKKSPLYTQNKNAYDAAVTNAATAIALAEQELFLAEATARESVASARPEARAQAEATLAAALARAESSEAALSDRVLRAPFNGTVVSLDLVPGETITTAPVLSLFSSERYELIARVPEVDIGKLALGQPATVVFDTRPDQPQAARIDFLSPQAITIDGVAYYEARLALEERPEWLRSGLNADIDIIIGQTEAAARLPERFIETREDGTSVVVKKEGDLLATTSVEILFRGNDGFVSLSGLLAGEHVVLP